MAWKRNEPDIPSTPSPAPASPAPPSRPQSSGRGGERAVIGGSITVQGDIKGQEDLTILGQVKGTIDVKEHTVTVGQSGKVKADVHAKLIVVEGRVEGNLFGSDQIVLRSTADVQGNLTAPRVALEDGAQFKGAIDMEPGTKAKGGGPGGPTGSGGSSSSGGASGSGSSGSGSSGSGSAKGDSGGGGKPSSGGASSSGSGSSGRG